jgi:HK97 family phage portal protein
VGLLDKVLSVFREKAGEGEYRAGPYTLSTGTLSADAGQYVNWWQMGHSLDGTGASSMVEACVSAYAQTVAMCPGNHWKWTAAGGRERVTTSGLVRILRYPNDYQTISDFLLNAVRALLLEGNAYALVLRNDRFEPKELHLMDSRSCAAQVATTGEIFYHLSGNPLIAARFGANLIVPARDVLHFKLHTPRHPLVGESPLAAAALELASGNAALQQQVRFYLNQARPSFILTTDAVLTKEQATFLRASWEEQAARFAVGGTPVLTAGLKAQPITSNAKDALLADMLKLSDQAIANVLRVPLQVLGVGGTPFASTEALMQSWRAGGLGFVLNHIEEAIGLLFKLSGQPDEYVEFDTSALLRSNFKERVDAWVAGVKGGVFPRNAALREFEMAPVEGGEEPWVQMQDLPLSIALDQLKNPPAPPPVPPAPEPPAEEEPDGERLFHDFTRSIDERVARHAQSLH